MIAFLLTPVGRYIFGAIAALALAGATYAYIRHQGVIAARQQIERENTDARNKADEGRARSERDSDAGKLREDDGFQRN